MSADEQLQRLLHALPTIAQEPGLSLQEIAQRVGSNEATLRRDLAALDRDDVPAGWVEAIALYMGPQQVTMRSAHFKRPMRLTRPELAALELGLGMLAQELPADEQRHIEDVRDKLAKLKAQPVETVIDRRRGDTRADSASISVASARAFELEHLATLHQAVDEAQVVQLTYQRPTDDAPSVRRVSPYGMLRADANIYLVAHCHRADALRVFRLDRVLHVELHNDRFTRPAAFELESIVQQGHVFSNDTESRESLVVRYGPAIARWIAERERRTVEADGSLFMRYPLADADWAVRHVLQYGPEAVIVAPESLQHEVRRLLDAMLR